MGKILKLAKDQTQVVRAGRVPIGREVQMGYNGVPISWKLWVSLEMTEMVDNMVIKQWRCQRIGLMFKNVLVHSITRGFSVPKTVILEQSLSLNSPGLESNLNLPILNDLSFTFDHRPTLSWKFVFHEKQYD